ncbi:hypothetical protein LTR35_010957 [Friedmanniomyces endolithicus]|uniref:Uncharacterized protein n=1 Tax=Friedmanniomyces endolithicus TaxID=329885 RepID=A0AAN6FE43_9PEZI|nr:hypothetical protein LTR35_010957 [Friedmanniomyces endolithicus]KAK0278374.1 hypothetical protein LTS00_013824 [Friedmanniomyces endolithicus]KAK0316205.1 hypothetical protein LTR82_012233 [Friedmanniomyces endolithicus]KAK0992526.1 hypothetical protein LTR54_011397 [Friedmanniomyces endolithicus]
MPNNYPSTPARQAPPPQEAPRSQIDFQFLNFSHPSDAKASNARKAVRSHVTKQQHQKEQKLQQERRAKSFPGTPSEPDQRLPLRRAHAGSFPPERPASIDLPILSVQRSAGGSLASSPGALSASSSGSPTASPTRPLERRIDPSELYQEAWHPYIPRIMDAYLSNMAVEVPDLDAVEIRDLLRTRFFPFAVTDAASFHAVLLVATTHYRRQRGAHVHAIDPLQLRGMAIREINQALEDPVRATSDQLIAAVAHMACFEALCGDRDGFNTHMMGLLRLVSMRGGLSALGLDGLLERILLWIDANATHIVGTRLYFTRATVPTISAVHPRPDPGRFAGGTA